METQQKAYTVADAGHLASELLANEERLAGTDKSGASALVREPSSPPPSSISWLARRAQRVLFLTLSEEPDVDTRDRQRSK